VITSKPETQDHLYVRKLLPSQTFAYLGFSNKQPTVTIITVKKTSTWNIPVHVDVLMQSLLLLLNESTVD